MATGHRTNLRPRLRQRLSADRMAVVEMNNSEDDLLLPSRFLNEKEESQVHTKKSKSWIFITISVGVILILITSHQHYSSARKPLSNNSANILRTKLKHTKSPGNLRSIIRPGSIFLDTDGNPINAHGGGFLFHNDVYYWYGEIKIGDTYTPPANADWGGSRVDMTGISCYSSKDLIDWKYRGNVLPAVTDDPSHDLYVKNVAERPKVVYNSHTNKFVMWLHIDSMDYKRARSGVAESDNPEGPFTYIESFRPNDQMARDLTVFVNEKTIVAYLITSSEDNAVMHINELTSNYTSFTGRWKRMFENRYMEAPTIFKRGDKYYFIGSGCTAWKPNAARSAVSKNIWGPWTELGNPAIGEDADTTFHSQSTFVLPIQGQEGFMFAADRWNEKNLTDSRYVWLPIDFEPVDVGVDGGVIERPIIRFLTSWNISNTWT